VALQTHWTFPVARRLLYDSRYLGNDDIGHKPYRAISATACTISATHNVDVIPIFWLNHH